MNYNDITYDLTYYWIVLPDGKAFLVGSDERDPDVVLKMMRRTEDKYLYFTIHDPELELVNYITQGGIIFEWLI